MKKILKKFRKQILLAFAIVGPGIITAFADNDAGGVATYFVSASRFGYSMLTITIPMTVVLGITQEIGSRLAVVTGKGLGDLIRERYSIKISILMFIVLFGINFAVILQNIGGLKEALTLFNLNPMIFLPLVLLFLFIFITKASYKKIEYFFLFLIFFYIAYFVSAILAKPDWNLVAKSLFVPTGKVTFNYLFTAIAVLGTTITAWGQFFINSYVKDKKLTPDKLKYNQLEIYIGAILTNVFSLFMMVAVIATLFVNGIRINTASDAAYAIEPFAGPLAGMLFGLGLFVAGFIGSAIVPLTTAYAFSEFFGFEGSLDVDFSQSKLFYIFFIVQVLMGMVVVLLPNVSLFKFAVYASFLNGIFLPIIFFFLYKFANDSDLMGSYKNTTVQNILLISASVVVTIASLTGVVGMILGLE